MQMQEIETEAATVRIRRAERRDIPCLLEMISALAAHHGDIPTVTARALERDLFGGSACASALIALRAGDPVGYAVLCSYPQIHFGRRVMELHHLYVAPDSRGAGVGRHLVAAAVEEARRQDCGRLTVGTHDDNLRAQAIYGSLGFTPQVPGGPRFGLDLPATGALPAGWV